MKSLFILFSGCCALYLQILCTRSAIADTCNFDLTQCRESGGPGQTSTFGVVTCSADGSLSVSIYINVSNDDTWNLHNGITVLYTCRSELGNVVKDGAIWNNTSVRPGKWLNRTVNIMYHSAMCRVYSCYSPDECNHYTITMVNTDCSFKPAGTSITTTKAVQSSLNTSQNKVILPTSSNYFLTNHSTTTHQPSNVLLAVKSSFSYEHQTSISVQQQITTATLLLSVPASTGVSMHEITNVNGLAVILPVMLVSVGGVVALTAILLCCIGYKHHYKNVHRINTTNLYSYDEVFDPYFNPIDVNSGVENNTAKSLHSIYDSVRNENKKGNDDSGTEDEKSEILVSENLSDDVSSNASIVISEEDKHNQECTHNVDTRIHDHEVSNFAKSPSNFCLPSGDSDYVKQNEMSQATPLTNIHRQVIVHQLQSFNTVKCDPKEDSNKQEKKESCYERYRDMKMLLKKSDCVPSLDGGMDVITSSDNRAGKETYYNANHNLQPISDDTLPECSLTLNHSHFEPID